MQTFKKLPNTKPKRKNTAVKKKLMLSAVK